MIGKLLPHTARFAPRTSYAQYAKDRITPRAAWTALRHLDGVDPDVAHVVMQATAKQSRRVKKPCGHLVLSWAQNDPVTPELMEAVADQTLTDLGLAEHQAMYVAHDDTEHLHLHIIYNRIHPETHKAARDSFQRLALRRSLVRQEQELGLIQTPLMSQGRHQRPLFSELQLAEREGRQALTRLSKQRCAQLREQMAYCFQAAQGWASFDGLVSRRGFELRPAGPGVRLVRHGHFAKLSDVLPPGSNAKQLTRRWGKFADYWNARHSQELAYERQVRKRRARPRPAPEPEQPRKQRQRQRQR